MKNILYVEDDDINALIMTKMLQGHYNVQVVSDGEQCLNIIRNFHFDLILMDINLGYGKIDGVETMKRVKAQEPYQHTPILAVTSFAMPEDKERFLKEGFDGYFAKPVLKDRILEAISRTLQEERS